jgi:hypothetical protein
MVGIEGDVVSCDLRECPNQLVVPPGSSPLDVVGAHDGWTLRNGQVRCPEHRDRRPWLS